MVTASFIWLILSHIAVFIPLLIGYQVNKRRWLACSIVLLITSFFSGIYHWHDHPESQNNFEIIGTGYNVHKSLDFFCSYLSIFLIVFYSINPKEKPEHIDIALMIVVIICHLLTLIEIQWYIFCLIVIFYCIIYKLFCRKTKWILTLKNIKENFMFFFLGTLSFVIGMVMQYYYCVINPTGELYYRYHGLWHFFMFMSAGMWIKWNEKIRNRLENRNNRIQVVSNNDTTINIRNLNSENESN